MKPILLDGASLTRDKLVEIAFGASVELDKGALKAVAGRHMARIGGSSPIGTAPMSTKPCRAYRRALPGVDASR